MGTSPDRTTWWLWPHLLALDAPAVAVVWQRFLATAFGVTLPVASSACLGLVVWGVYLLDRGLDARPGRPADPAARHVFAGRHRRGFMAASVVALLAGAGVAAAALPAASLATGAGVGLFLAAYLAAVHLTPGLAGGGKELAVGLVFAAGVAVPLVARAPERAAAWGPAVGGFAALCWLNCRLIDRWERGRSGFGWASVIAASMVAGAALRSPAEVGVALAVAVLGLAGLHRTRHRLGGPAVRVLADVVLLTPLLCGWRS